MAGKSSKLRCLNCAGFTKSSGGTLTRRRAGNGDENEYFYMMHYDPTKKSKKRSCYIGYSGLIYILIDDERYHTKYRPLLEGMMFERKNKTLDKDKWYKYWDVLEDLLIDMGWPKKFVFYKLTADIEDITLRERYFEVKNELKNSAFPEKRRLKMVDYSKCDDILDKHLSKLFRSVDRRLKPKT